MSCSWKIYFIFWGNFFVIFGNIGSFGVFRVVFFFNKFRGCCYNIFFIGGVGVLVILMWCFFGSSINCFF